MLQGILFQRGRRLAKEPAGPYYGLQATRQQVPGFERLATGPEHLPD
jgi:hypothetical protein